eukprot:s3946_g6.t1
MPAPVAADAQPRFDSRGRRLKGRTTKAKDHWKCDWCDYVARGKHWCAYRHAHLKAWHPEHLQDFGKKPPQFVRPGPEDEILWPCPFCDKALLQEDTPRSGDVLLQARLRHRRQCHPQIAKRHFLLAQARSGAQKATAARLADGVARRLLKHRKGDFGAHDVKFFRIPWTGKPAKKPRATRIVYACSSCRATADTARQLKAIPCERRPGSSSRVAFLGRLRALIDEDRHEASLLEGCRQLLACLTPPEDSGRRLARKTLPPPALREHDVVALAWPLPCDGGFALELRFACLRCAACRKSRRALETKQVCDAVVRGGARLRSELTRAAADADLPVARAAAHASQLLDNVLPATAAAAAAPTKVLTLADAGAAALEEAGGENSGPSAPAPGRAVHPVSASRSAAPLCLRADCLP